jgi:chaperonin cofactor prefoldin
LNYRLIEVSAELKQSKEDNEKLDDASAELMMAGSEGKVMLLIGEAFIETDEDEANECMTFPVIVTVTVTVIVLHASRTSRLL